MLFLTTEIRYNAKCAVNIYYVHGSINVCQKSKQKRQVLMMTQGVVNKVIWC